METIACFKSFGICFILTTSLLIYLDLINFLVTSGDPFIAETVNIAPATENIISATNIIDNNALTILILFCFFLFLLFNFFSLCLYSTLLLSL